MKILGVVKHFVLPYNGSMNAESKVIHKLRLSQKTLSVAESCSGGLIAHRLTNVPGCSDVFQGGVVTYSNRAKQNVLRVPAELLAAHGAVSREVARSMARCVRRRFTADFGLGVTGIAGPGGGSRRKPVGLVFIAVSSARDTRCLECRLEGDRLAIKKQTSTKALKLLYEFAC